MDGGFAELLTIASTQDAYQYFKIGVHKREKASSHLIPQCFSLEYFPYI